MTYAFISTERHGAVSVLRLDRPAKRNAQSMQMLDELDAAFTEASRDDDIRVIVLAGAGDHFSAGHDLKEAQESRADFTVEQRWAYEERRYYDYALRIHDCPKPTIAAVQGACIAAGFMVANMCDLVVASEDAEFSDPVVRTLGACAVEMLVHPWVLGTRRAKEVLFTGDRFTAAEGHAWGMVNRVVPRDRLDAAALELAQRIATAPAFSLRLVKRSLNRTLDIQGFRNALNAHFDTHQLSHVSEAFRAARDAGLASAIQKARKE